MIKPIIFAGLLVASILGHVPNAKSQTQNHSTDKVELLPYGDMNTWMPRKVKESGIIGGNERVFYEIAKGDTLFNDAYKNSDSPWALSSVLAKVKGITKVSMTVFPEKRGDGYAARLETRIEGVKVLGILSINVLASGTIFLGEMIEPITNTDNPMSKMIAGIPFTKRPKAVQYDYKVITGGKSIQSTGMSGQKKLDRIDNAEVFVYLQNRWEDAAGNVFAKRVGTGWEILTENKDDWQNKHQMPIYYGDASKSSNYINAMRLKKGDESYYTKNSKGDLVPIQEVGWADKDEKVTHMMLQFSSSNGGAYIGSTDSRLWIDNVGLVY